MLRINKEKPEVSVSCDELHHSTTLMKSPSSSYFTQLHNLIKTASKYGHTHIYPHSYMWASTTLLMHTHINTSNIETYGLERGTKGREEGVEGDGSKERVMRWSPRKTHMDSSCEHSLHTSLSLLCLLCLHDVKPVLRGVTLQTHSHFFQSTVLWQISFRVLLSVVSQAERHSFCFYYITSFSFFRHHYKEK